MSLKYEMTAQLYINPFVSSLISLGAVRGKPTLTTCWRRWHAFSFFNFDSFDRIAVAINTVVCAEDRGQHHRNSVGSPRGRDSGSNRHRDRDGGERGADN